MPRCLAKVKKKIRILQESRRGRGKEIKVFSGASVLLSPVSVCVFPGGFFALPHPRPVALFFPPPADRPDHVKWMRWVGCAHSPDLSKVKDAKGKASCEAIHILLGRRQTTRKHTHTRVHARKACLGQPLPKLPAPCAPLHTGRGAPPAAWGS